MQLEALLTAAPSRRALGSATRHTICCMCNMATKPAAAQSLPCKPRALPAPSIWAPFSK